MSYKRLKRTALALEDLEPALWGTLAPRLLHLVFLRLPVAQISQLRLLSKLWKAAIDSAESDFNLLLEDTVYPNLFGLVGRKAEWYQRCVWIFDVNLDRWYMREIRNDRHDLNLTVGAADGGLVCFVSDTTKPPLIIVVMNPLTRKMVKLPRLLSIYNVRPTIQPSMFKLKMNRKSNHYQVLFVGFIQSGSRGLLAQVYDSGTKEWSIVGSREKSWGRIFGYAYAWKKDGDCYNEDRRGPCLYDFAQGQLRRFNVYDDIARGCLMISYAMLGARLFVLHTEEHAGPSNLYQKCQDRKYYISEYHLPKNATDWVTVETHSCKPFDGRAVEDYHFALHACHGVLMVMVRAYNDYTHASYHYVWRYNLSTYKWHFLPNLPGIEVNFLNEDLMCELRWSATP